MRPNCACRRRSSWTPRTTTCGPAGAGRGAPLLSRRDPSGRRIRWPGTNREVRITMRIGADLYDKYGDDLTEEQLRRGVNDAMDQMEQAQRNGEDVPQVRTRK
ncbi:hypothetical protein GTY72_29475 [Streptomyces sp. SID8378]|nr:hypothetical protein [Streptomyces sp. SID8378]